MCVHVKRGASSNFKCDLVMFRGGFGRDGD